MNGECKDNGNGKAHKLSIRAKQAHESNRQGILAQLEDWRDTQPSPPPPVLDVHPSSALSCASSVTCRMTRELPTILYPSAGSVGNVPDAVVSPQIGNASAATEASAAADDASVAKEAAVAEQREGKKAAAEKASQKEASAEAKTVNKLAAPAAASKLRQDDDNNNSTTNTSTNTSASTVSGLNGLELIKIVEMRLHNECVDEAAETLHTPSSLSGATKVASSATHEADAEAEEIEEFNRSHRDQPVNKSPFRNTAASIPAESESVSEEALDGRKMQPRIAVGIIANDNTQPGAYAIGGIDEDSLDAAEQGQLTSQPQPQPQPQPHGLMETDTSQSHSTESSGEASGLVVANLVTDSSAHSLDLPSAQQFDHKGSRHQTRQRTIICIATGFLVLVGVTVTLAALLPGSSNGDSSKVSSSPTQAPTQPLESYILPLLPSYTLDAMEVSDSPQSMAYQFLLNDKALSNYPDWRIRQRFALATFFHATGGPNWYDSTNWLNYSHHECDWFARSTQGISIDNTYVTSHSHPCEENPNGIYKHLWQWSNQLQGTVPLELFWLTSLQSISLYGNTLSGSLPFTVGYLTELRGINMAYTSLQGELPTEIGLLTNAKFLVLTNNNFNSTLPTQLGLLSKLEYLMLDTNQFSGTLPTELGTLDSIDRLYLAENMLTGTIPTHLGALPVITFMFINTNRLGGKIPTEFSNLSLLKDLYLSENSLTGQIPSEIGAMSSLSNLRLFHNLLSSTLPTELANLSHLSRLYLHENALTGPIPSELGHLKDVQGLGIRLTMSNNGMTGTIPSEIGQLSNSLVGLLLSANMLTGQIPSELGGISKLREIVVDMNQLTGTIPLEIAANAYPIASLVDFNVTGNAMLSGTVPTSLCSVDTSDFRFLFDCSDLLCGCDCVDCSTETNQTFSM